MSRPISYTSGLTSALYSYDASLSNGVVFPSNHPASDGLHDSTQTSSYASISGQTRGQSGYAYYDFNVSDIPQEASITAISCTIRARANSNNVGSQFQLCNGTTTKGSATNVTSNSTNTYNLTPGTWTRDEIENIKLRIMVRNNGARLYGATLTVNYSVNGTEYEVTISNSTAAITEPTGTTYVFQGREQIVTLCPQDLNEISITDNGNDIKNLLIQHQPGTSSLTFNPAIFEESNGTVSNPDAALTNTASTTYSQLLLRSNVYMIYGFDVDIPDIAVINSISCVAKYQRSATSTSINNLTIQLYSDTTAKGSAYSITGTSTATSSANLTVGTWTASELKKAKIRLAGNYTGQNNYYLRFYGANLTINYTINNEYYTYTISNISADHTIVISDVSSDKMYMKVNGSWVGLQKVHKKINGSWVEQTDLTNVFETNKIYVRN